MSARSSGEPAAVDEQDRAGHVGGVVAHEEQARLRLLLGRREAAEWVAADELGLGALRVRLSAIQVRFIGVAVAPGRAR